MILTVNITQIGTQITKFYKTKKYIYLQKENEKRYRTPELLYLSICFGLEFTVQGDSDGFITGHHTIIEWTLKNVKDLMIYYGMLFLLGIQKTIALTIWSI